MDVVSHLDPSVLERELLDRVARAGSDGPLPRVLVVVPTARLADHVARRLVERLGAVLGVEIATHRGAARRVLAAVGARVPRRLDPALEDAVLARVLERAPRGRIRDFVRDRPAARPALGGTLRDLREAGVHPDEAFSALDGADREIAELFARFTAALDALAAARDLHDDASLARAAARVAPRAAELYDAVVHHGAYDLVGVQREFVAALDLGRTVTMLTPGAASLDAAPALDVALPKALAGKTVGFIHAQGARAELDRAAAWALARIHDGAAPHEVAVIVRSFAPYSSAVEALFARSDVTWNTSFAPSLRRHPRVAGFVAAVRATEGEPARRWSEHAARYGDLLAATFPSGDPTHAEAATSVAEVLEGMRALEADLDERGEVGAREAAAFLVGRLDAASLPPEGHDGGGPRLLDAMQARGMTFRHVAVVGMNSGVWPRVAREDPFLSDGARVRLRDATGRPVPIALANDAEERLLLALTLGAARESVEVSWRRADEQGRPVVASLALRAIARAARPAARDVATLPAHPRMRLAALARDPAILSPSDELLLTALEAETGADAAEAVAARRPELVAGLLWVAATDRFAPDDLAYDGRVGPPAASRPLSVSALETLGRCPLQYFFARRLRVPEPERGPTPYDIDASVRGRIVHEVLRDLYARLVAEDAFDAAPETRRARARTILRELWSAREGEMSAARARPLEALARLESEAWRAALESFVAADLERLAADGARPVGLEIARTSRDCALPLPPLTARLDRIVEGRDGRRVGDYKTGGSLEGRLDVKEFLRGASLQAPVYAMLADADVELLGVGPRQAPPRGAADDPRFALAARMDPPVRDGVVETLEILSRLAGTGVFPIRSGTHCDWCAFRCGCRRAHPPTEFREERAEDARDARDVGGKTKTKPMLADVRARGGA